MTSSTEKKADEKASEHAEKAARSLFRLSSWNTTYQTANNQYIEVTEKIRHLHEEAQRLSDEMTISLLEGKEELAVLDGLGVTRSHLSSAYGMTLESFIGRCRQLDPVELLGGRFHIKL